MLMCVSVCCASCFYLCLYHICFALEVRDFDQCVTGPLFLANQSSPAIGLDTST